MSCTIVVSFVLFFKQKTAYEMRISDWSSDVCSSDLGRFEVGWSGHTQEHRRVHAHDVWRGRQGRRSEDGQGDQRDQSRGAAAEIEERRVGKECVSKCRSRWSQYH